MNAWEDFIHAPFPDKLAQLALLLVEFEALHPFLDGNGRIGRRGMLQKCLVLIIYAVSVTIFSFFLDWLDKYICFRIIASAESQGKIAENIAQAFVNIIAARGEAFFFLIILFCIICALIVFGLIRQTATLQLSWPVVLPEAIKFRQAMKKLGIYDPDDGIDFVRKHYVPVYIAFKPITSF